MLTILFGTKRIEFKNWFFFRRTQRVILFYFIAQFIYKIPFGAFRLYSKRAEDGNWHYCIVSVAETNGKWIRFNFKWKNRFQMEVYVKWKRLWLITVSMRFATVDQSCSKLLFFFFLFWFRCCGAVHIDSSKNARENEIDSNCSLFCYTIDEKSLNQMCTVPSKQKRHCDNVRVHWSILHFNVIQSTAFRLICGFDADWIRSHFIFHSFIYARAIVNAWDYITITFGFIIQLVRII